MARAASEPVLVAVTALAAGGDAVGRDPDGRVTFVAGAAPGEEVRARLVEVHRGHARAELVEVVRASPARVTPACPLAGGACGGCPWMHVSPAAQLAAKQAIAAGALRRVIAAGLALAPARAPVPPLGWRRRANYHWHRAPAALVLGFHARRTRAIADVATCPQLDPRLDAAVAAARATLGPRLRGAGELHALLGHRGDVHLVVVGDGDGLADVARALVGQAGVVGVALASRTGRVELGAARIEVEPGAEAAADEFAQASDAGNAALVAEVVARVAPAPGVRVLELFAGGGNFTRHLVAAGAAVVANDVVDRGIAGARFERGTAEAAVARVGAAGFDVLLLDPPRTGAAAAVAAIAALGAAAPPRVVYVSCDAATLARDLERLADAGYRPRAAQVLDLFPQTAHLEIVAVAER